MDAPQLFPFIAGKLLAQDCYQRFYAIPILHLKNFYNRRGYSVTLNPSYLSATKAAVMTPR